MPGVCDWGAVPDGALWKDEGGSRCREYVTGTQSVTELCGRMKEGLGAGRRVCACFDTSLFGLPFIRYKSSITR